MALEAAGIERIHGDCALRISRCGSAAVVDNDLGPGGANYNLIIGSGAIDPVSGSVPHRAHLCQIGRAE